MALQYYRALWPRRVDVVTLTYIQDHASARPYLDVNTKNLLKFRSTSFVYQILHIATQYPSLVTSRRDFHLSPLSLISPEH